MANEDAANAYLKVENLIKYFGDDKAVDDISFHIDSKETLAVVGESGCGKSTTGRSILKLVPVTSGKVKFEGQDITPLSPRAMRPLRRARLPRSAPAGCS